MFALKPWHFEYEIFLIIELIVCVSVLYIASHNINGVVFVLLCSLVGENWHHLSLIHSFGATTKIRYTDGTPWFSLVPRRN